MKRLIIVCLSALLLVSCADKGPVAPKEGRQSIVVEPDRLIQTKAKPVLDKAQKTKEWLALNVNAANAKKHIKTDGEIAYQKSVSIGRGVDIKNQTLAGPIVIRDIVYTLDSAFYLQATDLKTGEKLWRKSFIKITGTQAKSIGLASDDKKIYAVAGNGVILATDLVGNADWIRELNTPLRSAPVIDGGKIFVSSLNNELFVLDADNGKTLWQYADERTMTNFFGLGSPAVSDSVLVVPTTNGRVNAFDVNTGVLLWTEDMWTKKTFNPILDMPHMTASPVIEGKSVYLIGNAGKSGAYRLANGVSLFHVGIGGRETPIVSGNALYLITNQNQLVALSKNQGEQFWSVPLTSSKTDKEQTVWHGPVLVNDSVVVTSSKGDVIFYDSKTGQETRREVQRPLAGSPVFSGDTMLMLDTKGNLLFYQ